MKDKRPCRFGGHIYDHKEFRTCPHCECESRQQWRLRNRTRINYKQRLWRYRNPDKVKAYAKKWRDQWGPTAWRNA